ncbi:MAG: hypothetical protein ACKO18_00980, partial [Bacteroidota bacterium]
MLGVFLRVVARYRREVVRENLLRVYPNWNRVQLLALERGFYNYLGGLLWDLVRTSVGPKDLGQKKIQWENPEVLMDLAA